MDVVIDNKAFKLKFGFKCFMNLGQALGLETFSQVVDRFTGFTDTADLSFKQMDLLEKLVIAAVETHPENRNLDYSIQDVCILDYLLTDPDTLTAIISGFADSFPKNEGKPKAQRKTRTRQK